VTNSPLGAYAPLVASVAAIGIIGAWIIGEFLAVLHPGSISPAGLKEVALIAIGAVFGSAVAVNGYKAPLAATHTRLDATNTKLAALGTVVANSSPEAATAVRTLVLDDEIAGSGHVPA
jgi:hypothetical protein